MAGPQNEADVSGRRGNRGRVGIYSLQSSQDHLRAWLCTKPYRSVEDARPRGLSIGDSSGRGRTSEAKAQHREGPRSLRSSPRKDLVGRGQSPNRCDSHGEQCDYLGETQERSNREDQSLLTWGTRNDDRKP